jgi:hypothetical protein
MTIEIHNAELESMLRERLKSGSFASIEDMLLKTFKELESVSETVDPERKAKALAAAASVRELRRGVTLGRPEGVSLRDYAHIGHRY